MDNSSINRNFLRIKLNLHKLHEIFMKFYISQIIVYTKSGQLLVNWYESLNPFSMPEFAISNACRELVGIGWRPPHFNCSSVLTWITIGPGDVPGMNEMHRVISLCTILIIFVRPVDKKLYPYSWFQEKSDPDHQKLHRIC